MINSHFYDALQSSTQALSLALPDDPLNNQSGSIMAPTTTGDSFSEQLYRELSGIDEPMITDFPYNSYEHSSAHSGYTVTPLSNTGAQDSSMVTGLGNDFNKTRTYSLSLPGTMVLSEQHALTMRETDFDHQTSDSVLKNPLYFPEPSVHSPPVTPEAVFPNQVNVHPMEESKQKPGSIDSLNRLNPDECQHELSIHEVPAEKQHVVIIELDGKVHNVSVYTGDKAEFAQYFQAISAVDYTRLCNKCQDKGPAACIQQNNGSTNAIQPRVQAFCGEQDSSTSQPSKHRGRHDNCPPDNWQLFRDKLLDKKYELSIKEIALTSTSRGNFAAILNRRSFSKEERKTSNVSGTKGKTELDWYY